MATPASSQVFLLLLQYYICIAIAVHSGYFLSSTCIVCMALSVQYVHSLHGCCDYQLCVDPWLQALASGICKLVSCSYVELDKTFQLCVRVSPWQLPVMKSVLLLNSNWLEGKHANCESLQIQKWRSNACVEQPKLIRNLISIFI